MSIQLDESAVLTRSTTRTQASFREVFRSHSGFVRRVLLRLGVAEGDVEDAAQEVFLGVHRNLDRFEGRCALSTWIYGICQRRAVDYHRRARLRREFCSEDLPDAGLEARQEQRLALSEARGQLAQFLAALDVDKQSVFVLFELEGVPMNEVAKRMGCERQTAYSRLYAARRKLHARLVRLRMRS